MQKLKKRFIVPVVVFILGMCALIGTIYVVGEGQEEQNRTKADRKSTRLNSSHIEESRMPSSA